MRGVRRHGPCRHLRCRHRPGHGWWWRPFTVWWWGWHGPRLVIVVWHLWWRSCDFYRDDKRTLFWTWFPLEIIRGSIPIALFFLLLRWINRDRRRWPRNLGCVLERWWFLLWRRRELVRLRALRWRRLVLVRWRALRWRRHVLGWILRWVWGWIPGMRQVYHMGSWGRGVGWSWSYVDIIDDLASSSTRPTSPPVVSRQRLVNGHANHLSRLHESAAFSLRVA